MSNGKAEHIPEKESPPPGRGLAVSNIRPVFLFKVSAIAELGLTGICRGGGPDHRGPRTPSVRAATHCLEARFSQKACDWTEGFIACDKEPQLR